MEQLKEECIDVVYSINDEFIGCSQIMMGPVIQYMEGCFYDKITYQGNHHGNLFGKMEIKYENGNAVEDKQ